MVRETEEERKKRLWDHQPYLPHIDWNVVQQGLSDDELIIAMSPAGGNFTLISYCPVKKQHERRIVFQWAPMIIDYCRGCKKMHDGGDVILD